MNRLRWSFLKPRRLAVLALAVGALALLAGCGVAANPQTIFDPQSDTTDELMGLFYKLIVLAAVVFVVVEAALVYVIFRYRRRPNDPLPPQFHGSVPVEIAWTAAPAVLLLFVLVPTLGTIFKTQAPAPAGSLQLQVTGHQFWWEFQYPSLGIVTANEFHMPVSQSINASLTSGDVLHNFWVPSLAGQRNANPGLASDPNYVPNYLWWTPRTVGEFLGQCVELCGYSHANMRLRAFVDTPATFDAWVANEKKPAVVSADPVAVKGAQVFQTRGCASCHTITGTPAAGKVGPNLTHFGSRTTLAAGIMDNTLDNTKKWIHNPPAVKPGSIMPNLGLNEDDLTTVSTCLESLK